MDNQSATTLSPNNSSTSFNNPSLSSVSETSSSVYGRDSSTWQVNKFNSSRFVKRHGRSYCSDEHIPYPLPCDPEEVNHRQNLVHLLYRELFGGYFTAVFPKSSDIPKRVLDIGCGNGQWIASAADEFASRGRNDVEFVGVDIVPVHSDMTGVNFTFKQHDLLQPGPLPFETDEFDYIMSREMTMVVPNSFKYEDMFPEYMRILKPGGIMEIQVSDHTIRSLQQQQSSCTAAASPDSNTGAYVITPSTPFAARPENPYVQKWNEYLTEMLNKRMLSPVPCTIVQPLLVMETSYVGQIQQRRLALPLDEPVWEEDTLRNISAANNSNNLKDDGDGYDNYETPRMSTDSLRDDASFITAKEESNSHPISPLPLEEKESNSTRSDSNGNNRSSGDSSYQHSRKSSGTTLRAPPSLTEDAKGVRYLARELLGLYISSLEPAIREANNVPQDEWDRWYKDLMKNFFEERGLRGGECFEFGAWLAVKHPVKEKQKDKDKEKDVEKEKEKGK